MKKYTLTIIHIVLCLLAVIVFNNCSSVNQRGLIDSSESKETQFLLIDTKLKVHKYKHNIQWQFFIKANPRTEYCSIHFEWEDIRPIYRLVNEEMKWVFQVNKNKRSFK